MRLNAKPPNAPATSRTTKGKEPMTTPHKLPPQVRQIYFTGALAAIDRQLDRLRIERESAALELDKAKAELAEQTKGDHQ